MTHKIEIGNELYDRMNAFRVSRKLSSVGAATEEYIQQLETVAHKE